MMSARTTHNHLIDRLPDVRGVYQADEPLSRYSWFKVGGPAEVLFRPADEEDLSHFLANLPAEAPLNIIGNASNLLVRDGGVPGVVIRLGRAFSTVHVDGQLIRTGAGAADLNVARRARDAGLGGLEFLSGIPGTIGGAVRMNGGAYGAEIKDVFESARAIDRTGQIHQVSADDVGFSYRHTELHADWIITEATFRAEPSDTAVVTERMDQIQRDREESQPIRTLTGGSTFANPAGYKAWELIDQAGCRGLVRGGAMVSNLHCNFLVNTGNATAADIEGLGEEVRRRVYEKFNVTLAWEIRRMGIPAKPDMKEVEQ